MKQLFLLMGLTAMVSVADGQLLKKIGDKAKNIAGSGTAEKPKTGSDKSADSTNPGKTVKTDKDESASIKTYSKYDFVPGEKIIFFEDFMQDAVGDLPAKWNTNSSGETVTVEGRQGHWLKLAKPGWFMPDNITSLPTDFTLEYDVFSDATVHSWGLTTALAELKNKEQPDDNQQHVNSFTLNIIPGTEANGSTQYGRIKNGVEDPANTAQTSHFGDITKSYHIAIWRQKERLRVYFDDEKAWDVPKAFLPEAKLNSVYFLMQLSDNWHFFISNIRLAVGAADTRNKILTQNKWVTHGILFDVNSATIKPESYGTLKEMANVLKDVPDLKIKIVGHTDADGSDAANLDLSKRRAASVKAMLTKEFGIEEGRMEADGKGAREPIEKNDTPAGKANNRRVEFIKI